MPPKSQKKSTKTTKRSRVKYPGLVKSMNTKVRQELIDHDYIDKLTDKEKQFLSNFNEEYIGANFQHKGKKMHKSKKMKRDCYNRNNARNRDIHSISSVTGNLVSEDFLLEKETELNPEVILEMKLYLKENNLTLETFLEKRLNALNDAKKHAKAQNKLKNTD